MSDVINSTASGEWRARAWADLFNAAMQARSAEHRVTERAQLYLEAGLPLGQILEALGERVGEPMELAVWLERVGALNQWKARNREVAARVGALNEWKPRNREAAARPVRKV